MSKKNYEVMKVFDCQWDPGMPDDVKEAFFSFYECGNDTYVQWSIHDEKFEDENSKRALNKKKVDAWLIANGANPPPHDDEEGETVLIKHWW